MYHSITIGDMNTWDDWHLIPSSRPAFSMPQPSISSVEIPGRNGSIDTTEMNGKAITYSDRTGSFDFYVENGYWPSWSEAYSTIALYLHGKKHKAVLEDDPMYYYEGRFSVNEWRSNASHSSISISYQVGPYKKNIYAAGSDWLWDEMEFTPTYEVTGYSLRTIPREGLTLPFEGFGYRTVPTIICDREVDVYFDGNGPIHLNAGTNMNTSIVITEGSHELHFVGEGATVSVEYYGGSL